MKGHSFKPNIFLLPNLITTVSLFFAFYSIVASCNGNFMYAIYAIFIAMVADVLDGRVARLTDTSSEFGAQYDSLADVISFGLAPAILGYQVFLNEFNKIGWLITFIYLSCTALRLARFNSQVNAVDKGYFQGLPCPAAAASVVSILWIRQEYQIDIFPLNMVILVVFFVTSALMVSNIRYRKFSSLYPEGGCSVKSKFIPSIITVMILILVAWQPDLVIFLFSFAYLLSGLSTTLSLVSKIKKSRLKRNKKHIDE